MMSQRRRRRPSTARTSRRTTWPGNAPEEWMPLRPPEFYGEHASSCALDARRQRASTSRKRDGRLDERQTSSRYDALLLATGAEPVHLRSPGADLPHVHYLRTLADSRAHHRGGADSASARWSSAPASSGWRSLPRCARAGSRSTSSRPRRGRSSGCLGPSSAISSSALHEEHGVDFHLGRHRRRHRRQRGDARDGGVLAADLVVAGVGVRPAHRAGRAGRASPSTAASSWTSISRRARRASSRRATSRAGPIRTPATASASSTGWWRSGRARPPRATCSGARERFDAVPFFWSQHYDVTINYVGHAESGTRWRSRVSSRLGIASCVTSVRAGSWRLPRSIATSQVFRPK